MAFFKGRGLSALWSLFGQVLSPRTAPSKWTFTTGGEIESAPAISKTGTIYFGSDDKKLYAVDGRGRELWEFPTGGAVYSPTIAPDGTIYFQSSDGNLYAVRDQQANGGLDGQWAKLAGGLKNMARAIQNGQ